MSNPFLSVVIPSFNEMRNLRRGVLAQVIEFLETQDYTWEVVLTDDGSTDGTTAELLDFAQKHKHVKVVQNPHGGKAPTVMAGMLAATGSWRLFTDFDQSTPLAEVNGLLVWAKKGYDVVIGSREISGAARDKEPLYRHVMGRGFNLIVQLFAVPGILDTQCGFKLFSAVATERLFPKLYIYGGKQIRQDAFTGAFDVELLFLAYKHGFQIKEVPIQWKHFHTDRVSPIKDSVRMFRDILKIRIAALQGKYK